MRGFASKVIVQLHSALPLVVRMGSAHP